MVRPPPAGPHPRLHQGRQRRRSSPSARRTSCGSSCAGSMWPRARACRAGPAAAVIEQLQASRSPPGPGRRPSSRPGRQLPAPRLGGPVPVRRGELGPALLRAPEVDGQPRRGASTPRAPRQSPLPCVRAALAHPGGRRRSVARRTGARGGPRRARRFAGQRRHVLLGPAGPPAGSRSRCRRGCGTWWPGIVTADGFAAVRALFSTGRPGPSAPSDAAGWGYGPVPARPALSASPARGRWALLAAAAHTGQLTMAVDDLAEQMAGQFAGPLGVVFWDLVSQED